MNIFISLTTVPERLILWHLVSQNLNSLLKQNTDKDYKVVFNIPYTYKAKGTPYVLPTQLEQFAKDNPKLIINRIETDRGPIEKVAGCLNLATNPDDLIIAVDDDQIYHEDMLEYILKKREQYPHSAIGFRGDTVIEKREFVQRGIKKYVLLGTHAFFPLKHDVHAAVPGHWHSVTYMRKFFTDDFLTDKYLGVADADDHIMSYYMRDKKIDYVMVAWDKETNWIPVNGCVNGMGRPSHHFPIKDQLSFNGDTGFNVLRKKTGDHIGYVRDDFTKDWQFNYDRVYYEPPFTEADEPIITVEPSSPPVINEPLKEYPPGDAIPKDLGDFTYPPTLPIIALTTIPSRLKAVNDTGLKSCIGSLLSQNYPGDYEVHFNIPMQLKSGEKYEMPDWLINLANNNERLKIFRIAEDYGPVTKLLPTVQRLDNPETIIVVADDDLIYHPEMLKQQVMNQSRFPNSAVGYDGLSCWVPIYHDVRDHYITATRKHRIVKVIQHYKTVSYKRKYFDDDFKTFLDEYYNWCDDQAVSAYMGSKGIRRVCTFSEKYTPQYDTAEEWTKASAAITFPVISHTIHGGDEGCTVFRSKQIPNSKKNIWTSDLIEKYIPTT